MSHRQFPLRRHSHLLVDHRRAGSAAVADPRGANERNRLIGSGGRLQIGMVAGFKSEPWPASNRNPRPASVGIRILRADDGLRSLVAPCRQLLSGTVRNILLVRQPRRIEIMRRTPGRIRALVAHRHCLPPPMDKRRRPQSTCCARRNPLSQANPLSGFIDECCEVDPTSKE